MNTFGLGFIRKYLLPWSSKAFNQNSGGQKVELDFKKNSTVYLWGELYVAVLPWQESQFSDPEGSLSPISMFLTAFVRKINW